MGKSFNRIVAIVDVSIAVKYKRHFVNFLHNEKGFHLSNETILICLIAILINHKLFI